MIKRIISLVLMLMSFGAWAQGEGPQMADAMRENGKIYIVISVISLIFLALVIFMVYLERRVKKLEEEIKKGN
jgi:uncharacterized membrane protein